MDLDARWALHPQVAVRPEPFGALLYHFGTRTLSFLKDRRLLALVTALDRAPSVGAALDDAGLTGDDRARYVTALDTLARSHMLKESPS